MMFIIVDAEVGTDMVTILDCISCKKGIIKNGEVLSCGKPCEYEFGKPKEENDD